MFQYLPSLKALQAFESAARLNSFNAAAAELSVTPGAVSYQIKQLEASLNCSLFHRRTRQIELTDEGLRLHQTAYRMFELLSTAVDEITQTRSETQLTVSVSTFFVTRWLSPRLGRFLSAHPTITIGLQHSVNDSGFNLKEADVAIKWGDGKWNDDQLHDNKSELLFKLPMIAVCSPRLLTGENSIENPTDVGHHTLLHDQADVDRWPEWLQLIEADDNLASAKKKAQTKSTTIIDPNVRVQAAIDGHGIVLANPLLKPDIDSGLLVEPFNIPLHGYGYYLVFTPKAARSNAFKLFRLWLQEEASCIENDLV